MTSTDASRKAEVERIRGELAQTLNAIEDKLNVPRQIKRRVDRVGAKLRTMADENPLALAGVAVGVAVVVGGVVWAIAAAARK